MYRQQKINISEEFAVLCCFWNKTPEQVIRFYVEHVSLSALINRIGVERPLKPEYSQKELIGLMESMIDDPYALATLFTAAFVQTKPGPTYPKKLPKINRKTPF